MARGAEIRRRLIVASLLTIACVAAACSEEAPASRAVPAQPAEVSVSTVPGTLLALPQYVAEERGFFEANGLDVTFVPTTSGPTAMQALLSGDVDIMLNSPDLVLQANDKGRSVKYIVGNTGRSITTLLVRNDWPLPNRGDYPSVVRDLDGATIGVTARGSTVENQLRIMLEDAGLDPDRDVTIVPTGVLDTAIPALDTGRVDAWFGFEPGTSTVVHRMGIAKVVVDLRAGEGPSRLVEYSPNGYAATTEYVAEHPDVVRSFVKSVEAAHRWLNEPGNRAELEAVVARHLEVDPSLVPRLIDDNLATFSVTMPEPNIEHAIELMRESGLIGSTPTYDDVVATDYMPER